MYTQPVDPAWLEAYAKLALRVNRALSEAGHGAFLDYRGPDTWRTDVTEEELPPPGRLIDDAEKLLADLPADPQRATYLAGQIRALRAMARRLDGQVLPLNEFVRECLDVSGEWLDEAVFEEAHATLDAALPGPGSLAEKFHRWQDHHRLPTDAQSRIPDLIASAVAETRRRTNRIVSLPEDEEVGCTLIDKAPYLAAGYHAGGSRSSIFINTSLPFNLADLLYVVAHEGHPGHIAEQVLKERHLVQERGLAEQNVRFMISPHFVLSEGLGLHGQDILFSGDEAQAWLRDTVLAEYDIPADGSDFAAIHRARNVLFGVWTNAALLLAQGRPEAEVASYLMRWALIRESEVDLVLPLLNAPVGAVYVFCYYQGWELLRPWLDAPDRDARVRRLLTEQLHPATLNSATPASDSTEGPASAESASS